MDNRKWQRLVVLAGAAFVVSLTLAIAGARALGASNECRHQVRPGDTLWRLSADYGTTVDDIAEWSRVTNPDLIYVDDVLIVCVAGQNRPLLLPEHAQAWSDAVTASKPSWATTDDVRFMVAVAQFESAWCRHVWNPNDAGVENGVRYLGSYGCVQIRVTESGQPAHRNLDRLEAGGMPVQAEAAWIVASERRDWGMRWRTAWGPWGRKLAGDCTELPARRVDDCRAAWAIADRVLGLS